MFERVLRADVCAQSPSNNPGEEKKEGEGGGRKSRRVAGGRYVLLSKIPLKT